MWKTCTSANGALITLLIGGAPGAHRASLDRVEISPMEGGGMPLVYRPAAMRLVGHRLAPEGKTAVSLGARQGLPHFS